MRFSAYAAGAEMRRVMETAANATTSEVSKAEYVRGLVRIASYHCKVNPCGKISCQKRLNEKMTGMHRGTTIKLIKNKKSRRFSIVYPPGRSFFSIRLNA